jgi:hypothetical protein
MPNGNLESFHREVGHVVAQLLEALCYKPEGLSLKNSNDTIGNRSRDLPVRSAVPQPLRHRGPLTEMSTRNNSWGVTVTGAYGWHPYHLHVPTVFKSGSLKLLEPSGPVQACNGIALPLPLVDCLWMKWTLFHFHTHSFLYFWLNICLFSFFSSNSFSNTFCFVGLFSFCFPWFYLPFLLPFYTLILTL